LVTTVPTPLRTPPPTVALDTAKPVVPETNTLSASVNTGRLAVSVVFDIVPVTFSVPPTDAFPLRTSDGMLNASANVTLVNPFTVITRFVVPVDGAHQIRFP